MDAHSRIRQCRIIAGAVIALLIAISTLALVDFWRVGRIPAPCADQTTAEATALVPSGAPRYRRTRHAVALYRRARVGTLVFSGAGSGGDSARNLAGEARRSGVPSSHIVIEGRASSTAENFRYACALPAIRTAPRVAIVTDRFHAYRAWATARNECSGTPFCSATVDGPVSRSRRFSEAARLIVYQMLGRAALW